MISVEEALGQILDALKPLPAETVSLGDGLGRILTADVVSRTTHPPADVSAMDGYAVRAADLADDPTRLKVVGEVAAGASPETTVGPGESIRIFTGAPVPDGADSIVIQEVTTRDGDWVLVREKVALGHYVRRAGLDFKAGETGLRQGTRLGVREIGLAAAMDYPWLKVRRRPRIALLATGDEVVLPGEPKGRHQIISSNGAALAAFVRLHGGEPQNLGVAPDDPEALEALLAAAAGADLIVTTGGASVGDHDLIRGLLAKKRMDLAFWKIAMRPGKPLIFGHIDGTPLLGLPGNPVSAIICSLIFLGPALRRMLGLPGRDAANRTAILSGDLPANDQRQDYLRARYLESEDGALRVQPYDRQDSSMLRTLCDAQCLIVRPPFAAPLEAGAMVDTLALAPEFPSL